MSILYIQQLLGFLLLVSLFHMIKTDRKTVSEKSENLSKQDKVMFREIADGAVKKTNIIGDGKKINALEQCSIKNYKPHENLEGNEVHELQTMRSRRNVESKEVINLTTFSGMDCYSCFTNTTLRSDDNCYDGVS